MTKERDAIEAAQDALAEAKAALRDVEKHLTTIMQENADPRPRAMNAAFGIRERVKAARAGLGVIHADATEALFEHFPDHAVDITIRGGGGGR